MAGEGGARKCTINALEKRLHRTWVQLLLVTGEYEAAAVAENTEVRVVPTGAVGARPISIILGLPQAEYERVTWQEGGVGAVMESAFRVVSRGRITDSSGATYDGLPIRHCVRVPDVDEEEEEPR